MENLTKTQMVLLVLLVSFVTSFVTGIVTVALIDQAPARVTETFQKVVEFVRETPSENMNNSEGSKDQEITVIFQDSQVVKIVREVSPAVVSVVASKDVPVIDRYFINPFFDDPLLKDFIPEEFFLQYQVPQEGETKRVQVSSGSGFFVSKDGMLITNRHVVGDIEADYTIVMNNGKKLSAKVLARDPAQDIAVLKVEGDNFPFISLGNSDNINIGETVVVIGNALGEFQNTVSVGIVSGLRRTIIVSSGTELREVIQTDAAINLGNSGGPVLDLTGKAIGISTAVARGAENIGFALPINFISKAISDVNNFGEIRYAYLGVRYAMINAEIAKEKNLSVDRGALVMPAGNYPAVMPNSPAFEAGVKEGDVILEISGEVISPDKTLASIISQRRIGDEIELKILRDGEEIILKVKLAERPENL